MPSAPLWSSPRLLDRLLIAARIRRGGRRRPSASREIPVLPRISRTSRRRWSRCAARAGFAGIRFGRMTLRRVSSPCFFLPAEMRTSPATAIGMSSLDRLAVDAGAALRDQPPGLVLRGDEAEADQRVDQSDLARRPSASAAPRRAAPSSKVLRAVSAAAARRLLAVQHRRRGVGQRLLGLVDLGALERLQPGDLVQRQIGEQAQEAADVGVLGVPPELPVIVGRRAGPR